MTNLNGIIFAFIWVPEEEEREKGIESLFEEIIVENFSSLGKEIVSQAMEVHRSPNTRDQRMTTPRYIIIKMAKKDHRQG